MKLLTIIMKSLTVEINEVETRKIEKINKTELVL